MSCELGVVSHEPGVMSRGHEHGLEKKGRGCEPEVVVFSCEPRFIGRGRELAVVSQELLAGSHVQGVMCRGS